MDNNGNYENYENYENYGNYEGSYNMGYNMSYNQTSQTGGRRLINAGMILGLTAVLLMVLGLVVPCVDFSEFNSDIHIQYNLLKVCKNVGLISSMWMGIPYGIIIGIVILAALSFVNIPIFRIIPCILVIAMCVLMLADINNVVNWINDILAKYNIDAVGTVDTGQIFHSIMAGAYCLAAGVITGLISCFVKAK